MRMNNEDQKKDNLNELSGIMYTLYVYLQLWLEFPLLFNTDITVNQRLYLQMLTWVHDGLCYDVAFSAVIVKYSYKWDSLLDTWWLSPVP
jgi:hypothetical protein